MPLITLNESKSIRYEFDPEANGAVLGQGGMGVVYKGRRIHNDTQSFEHVAIKVLFRDLPIESIERARREASIQIEHENLLRMYGFLEAKGSNGQPIYHVISEYIDGTPLSDILKIRGSLPQNEAINIVKKILSAVNMLHDAGYAHRDIDPSNIMICNGSNRVKLIDFGIVRRISDEFTQNGTIAGRFIGKPKYAPPEQARGEHNNTNATSDIYLIGITLYELLCGSVPFKGETHEIIQEHIYGDIKYDRSINSNLRYVIGKATAKLQRDRYQSASGFIVDLETIERGGVLSAKKSSKQVLPIIIAGAISTLLLLVGVAIFIVRSNYNETLELAEQQLSIGLYESSLNHYRSASKFINSDDVKSKISMLEFLVPAVDAYNKSDYENAEKLFNSAAHYDSADAYYYLGEMSYEGIGIPKNYDQGFAHTMKAQYLGSVLAEYRLGLVYKNGLGVLVDNNNASKHFEAASEIIDMDVDSNSNNPELLFIKGCMYLEGNYVQQSKDQAINYFVAAADLDYPQAQYELYLAIKDLDATLAHEYLTKAVNHGYPKAVYEMCQVYWLLGDLRNAYYMAELAASKNYSPAYQALGAWYGTARNYAEKIGIKSDDSKSHYYTCKALEYDFENIDAMCDIWYDYSNGIGVKANTNEADKYKRMALAKLDRLQYTGSNGMRIYDSERAQIVWNKLSK